MPRLRLMQHGCETPGIHRHGSASSDDELLSEPRQWSPHARIRCGAGGVTSVGEALPTGATSARGAAFAGAALPPGATSVGQTERLLETSPVRPHARELPRTCSTRPDATPHQFDSYQPFLTLIRTKRNGDERATGSKHLFFSSFLQARSDRLRTLSACRLRGPKLTAPAGSLD